MSPAGYNKTQMAYSAAAMYGGAAFLGLAEGLIAGGQTFSLEPALIALGVVITLLAVGPRLPFPVIAALGPIGAALIAVAIATTPEPGDGAVFYAWPVLWSAYYFGIRGTVFALGWVAVAHGIAILSLSGEASTIDRWMDVVVSMTIVAVVTQALSRRNRQLLASSLNEARTDTLTGLLNRRGFEERMPLELERASREGHRIAVVSFDIDYFKRVNDEWGHEIGDRVLVALGDVFRAESRETDLVTRMGGEEFTTVISDTSPADAIAYAERIRAAFAAVDVGAGHVTISAGITTSFAPHSADPLLLAADSALYAAKCGGRDRAVCQEVEASLIEAELEPVAG